MDEPARRGESAAEIARQAAVRQAVSQLVYLGLAFGLTWVLANRDAAWRAREAVMRRWRARNADPYALEMAEFRRELHDIERGSDGSSVGGQPPGLYGPDAGRF